MKYVKELVNGDAEKLRNILKNCPSLKARMRAGAILFSSKSISIDVIASIFDVHRDTISNWIFNWERKGFIGLFDEPKPGRPRQVCKENLITGLMDTVYQTNETATLHEENVTGNEFQANVTESVCQTQPAVTLNREFPLVFQNS